MAVNLREPVSSFDSGGMGARAGVWGGCWGCLKGSR